MGHPKKVTFDLRPEGEEGAVCLSGKTYQVEAPQIPRP